MNVVSQDPNRIESVNQHIAFFAEDKVTPFEKIKITTNSDLTSFAVYLKNIASFDIKEIEIFLPTGVRLESKEPPTELKSGSGFFLHLEVDSSANFERFIEVTGKPHQISFE